MTALSCERVRDLLPGWLAGDRESTERSEVGPHLASCEDCRAEAALLGALVRSAPPVPATLEAQVLRATRRRPSARAWGWSARRLAAAATLVGAVIGGSVLLDVMGSRQTPGGTSAGRSVAEEASGLVPVLEDPLLYGGSVLPNLTEAELEQLLAGLES